MVDYSGLVQRTKVLIHTVKKSGSCVCVYYPLLLLSLKETFFGQSCLA